MKLQAKLKQAEKDRAGIDDNIKELRRQIEAAKLPLLRHGDYGYNDEECGIIITKQTSTPKAFYSNGDGQIDVNGPNNDEPNIFGYTILGNIDDDLAALSEDVEEFESGCSCYTLTAKWASAGSIVVTGYDDEQILIKDCSIDDFILRLRQMRATQLRAEAKKE